MTYEELLALAKKLRAVGPCAKHGYDPMIICLECREDIRCSLCEFRCCQCWNDE